ncbi:unnamed protein product [Symbiodinium necroappetens]|uniref:Uncharacterized protein n=1 Tax=Symbiodinium necroappetens TaxID=1628268 RepID=A0A812UCR1_9DINO|nr:unnamed protein product [Symbiodinium necroappetens]
MKPCTAASRRNFSSSASPALFSGRNEPLPGRSTGFSSWSPMPYTSVRRHCGRFWSKLHGV